MRLKQIKMTGNGLGITPVFEKDIPLFKHCTGGKEYVTEEVFRQTIWPILKPHILGTYLPLIEPISKYEPSAVTKQSEEDLEKHLTPC